VGGKGGSGVCGLRGVGVEGLGWEMGGWMGGCVCRK